MFRRFRCFMVIITTLTMLSGAALAQQERKLTLQEAIDLSIKNSKLLKNSQAKIDEATGALKESRERRLPDFSVTGSYIHLNNPNVNLKAFKDTSTNNGTGAKREPVKVSQAAYGIVNLSLPIYSGHRILYGIESAKYLEKAVKLDAENDRESLIINTIEAYSSLYKAKAATELVKESLKQSQQRVRDFSNLEKNGLLARNDLLKAQLQSSNIELSLADAESNSKLATVHMNLMLGLPEETVLLTDTATTNPAADTKSITEWEQVAILHRKDLTALSLREKAAFTGVKAVRGEMYPSLAFTAGYIGIYVPNVLTVTNALNVGLGLQYNIGSLWKTKSKIQQAEARVVQVKANEEMLQDAIRLQINQSYEDVLLSRKKIDVYKEAIEQAAENYKITKNKYDNSLVTTTDLLEAEVAQLQTKLNFAFAKADAMLAYNKLLHVTGTIK